jgi:short subunit dehydrogenase-like uncharacterized protein
VSDARPVVVYGASGSTGRLIAEYLRELNVPFVAAGRNADRLTSVMAQVPGIETADYEVAATDGSVESLTELFRGRKVVCNVVGPFLRYAPVVLEAAYNAGCHYLDTAGEQKHMLWLQDEWSEKFAAKGLVISSAMSIQYAVHDIAAQICLETPGVDTLELGSFANAIPTVASTQSIFDVIRAEAFYLENGKLERYPGVVLQDIVVPGTSLVKKATNWGGTAMPVFYRHDRRVQNCSMYVAMQNQTLWRRVIEVERLFKVALQWLPEEQLYPLLDGMAASITPADPPRENRQVHRSIDWCVARGNNRTARVIIHSSTGYQITGLLQAYAAMRLLGQTFSGVGFRSPAVLLGHRELMGALESYGFARITEETSA